MFADRRDAGRRLAEALGVHDRENTIVLAIPRGGVIVAEEVARALKVPMDLIIPRKIGAPMNEELAIGAVAPDRTVVLNDALVKELRVLKSYIDRTARIESIEIDRRSMKYRGRLGYPDVEGMVVILVDDGVATGYTVKACLKFLRKISAKKVIVATPVSPSESVKMLEEDADEVVCLESPEEFSAIGQFYRRFEQVTDDEVLKSMNRARV